jgi:hypothetical protein
MANSDPKTAHSLGRVRYYRSAGVLKSGKYYAPGYLHQLCGVYSTWQASRFAEAAHSAGLASYTDHGPDDEPAYKIH